MKLVGVVVACCVAAAVAAVETSLTLTAHPSSLSTVCDALRSQATAHDHCHLKLAPGSYSDVQALEQLISIKKRCRLTVSSLIPESPAVLDGSIAVSGWTLDSSSGRWKAAAPSELRDVQDEWPDSDWTPVRQLYVNGTLFARTETAPSSICLSGDPPESCGYLKDGAYFSNSSRPLSWRDPRAVEIVSDGTFTQHRCVLSSIQAVTSSEMALQSCQANWTMKVQGASPGSIMGNYSNQTWESCQQHCCELGSQCKAVIFHPSIAQCYALPRTYNANFQQQSDSYVANMNAPPAPKMVSKLTIEPECYTTGSHPRASIQYPSAIVNTGEFASPTRDEWFFDRSSGTFELALASGGDANMLDVRVGFNHTLLQIAHASNVDLDSISFRYATWLQPNRPAGFIERYGNVHIVGGSYVSPSAALMIANSSNVSVTNCDFRSLGMWGLRVYNGTQHVTIDRNVFEDLGGGSICVGNVNDTAETDAAHQMAYVAVTNNVIRRMSVEYKGAPGLHTFCMRDSVIGHNEIQDVGYTGISFNWPDPQGPTLGPHADSPAVGYSRNNHVVSNDVSGFMSYMLDGGGIHTIGRSLNTSVSLNYFHNISSGQPGMHSVEAQSIIYIDNWSSGFQISENVVDHCQHTKQGFYYFQHFPEGLANNNYLDHLYVRDSAAVSGRGAACNCSAVVVVSADSDLPAAAQNIVAQAGPTAR